MIDLTDLISQYRMLSTANVSDGLERLTVSGHCGMHAARLWILPVRLSWLGSMKLMNLLCWVH